MAAPIDPALAPNSVPGGASMGHQQRLLIVLLVLSLAVPATAGQWPHERDGFALGFNFGAGSASTSGEDDDAGGGIAWSFRAGWAFDDQFLVGLENTSWFNDTFFGGWTLSSYKLNFTWYPGAKGWFVRGGFGVGVAELSLINLFGSGSVDISESGGSFGLGAGHEWRLTRRFALGAAMDYYTIDLDNKDWESFNVLNFTAQFNWYF
jgi:hypothetical protein